MNGPQMATSKPFSRGAQSPGTCTIQTDSGILANDWRPVLTGSNNPFKVESLWNVPSVTRPWKK